MYECLNARLHSPLLTHWRYHTPVSHEATDVHMNYSAIFWTTFLPCINLDPRISICGKHNHISYGSYCVCIITLSCFHFIIGINSSQFICSEKSLWWGYITVIASQITDNLTVLAKKLVGVKIKKHHSSALVALCEGNPPGGWTGVYHQTISKLHLT